MIKRTHFILFLALSAVSTALSAQTIQRWDSVRVKESNTQLRNPSAGGLNAPEFSPIDLDNDGTLDLFIFDRSGRKVLTFLNGGTAGQVDYDFAPEYIDNFPTGITEFALCRDFNCDGLMDLFFGTTNGVKVYENTSTVGNPVSFQLYADTLFTDLGAGPALFYVYTGDIPDFVDVDGDGDLDALTYNSGGTTVEWHKNTIQETSGNCNGMVLEMVDACWGNFIESGLNQDLTLGYQCRFAPTLAEPGKPSLHAGSTLAAFDEEPDGDFELVIGDLLYDGLTYTHNAGTNVDAEMDSIDIQFPSYDASVGIDIFPAGYFVDVDNDGKKDMLTAPNQINVSINYDNSWYYKNVHPSNGVLLSRQSKNFLTSQMVDVGMCAYPTLFDHNGDGLMDLVIGNYNRKTNISNASSVLFLYENTGTATAPVFSQTSRNYAGLQTAFNPAIQGITPSFGDMDGDGDKDMIIGDADGKLHYLTNTAPQGQVANFPNVTVNYSGIDVGLFAAPCIVDIDRDGDNDMIVGEMSGTLKFFENTGTAQSAVFSATAVSNWGGVDTEPICCTGFAVPFIYQNPVSGRYDLLLGSERGDLKYYEDIESELGGNFTLDQANFGNITEGSRTAITGADLTGDGIWEWFVGNVRGGIGFYQGNLIQSSASQAVTASDWEVYPNPTSGALHVRGNDRAHGALSLQLMDIQGRMLLATPKGSAAHGVEIDLGGLPDGIYLLRMELNGAFAGVRRVEVLGASK
ncbi:MAG: FG-GAP-like repeat-containing protein [Bacteroidia bacterium]